MRFINELNIADEPVSHTRFTGRLSELIDLSQSIKISMAHNSMNTMEFEPFENSMDAPRIEFMRVHGETVQTIVQSFAGDENARLKTPPPTSLSNEDKAAAVKPYLSFYVYFQRMLESKVRQLRGFIRDSASGLSMSLAQLAKLDEVLESTLANHERKTLGRVRGHLDKQFSEQLTLAQENHNEPNREVAMLTLHDTFCQDMKALLLAELEVRMLPVQGLIEAIEAEHADQRHQ